MNLFFYTLITDAHIVRWAPDGDKYVVVVNDKMDIYDLETASVTGMITNPKRISSVVFLNVSSLTLRNLTHLYNIEIAMIEMISAIIPRYGSNKQF